MTPPHRVCFSDIDGTIMHEPKGGDRDAEILITPPSTSGRQGVISAATIKKVAALRGHNVKFVVISGARLSTLLMRLPYLPAGDAFVCESGGRIFYPGSALPTACPIREDEAWRVMQEAAGPMDQDALAPEKREGLLWSWYIELKDQGWTLDANGYTTSFRIHAKNGKSVEELKAIIDKAPKGIDCSWNLGAADFFPSTSGKVKAARYLMKMWDVQSKDSVFLCDDDNDMQLAVEVGKAFLPSITSDSVRKTMEAFPDQFVTAVSKGTVEGTEEMLDAVFEHYQLTPQNISA